MILGLLGLLLAMTPTVAADPAVATGRAHSCAVTATGGVHCWGSDSDGQLGDGEPPASTTRAVPVLLPASTVAVRVDAGEEHTCALDDQGVVLCWGDNSSGQLGVGDRHDRHAPVRTAFAAGRRVIDVAAGDNHTCAVEKSGVAWCWGAGAGGAEDSDRPVRVSAATGLTDPIADIAAGGDTTCAATVRGAAWCWGSGHKGQLGNGKRDDARRPVRVPITGVRQIAVGKQQSCAVVRTGAVWCWGRTVTGVETRPVRQDGPAFARVAVGGEHVCGLDRRGGAWCWGAGGKGQLGAGDSGDATEPRRVAAPVLTALDTGDEHTCALDDADQAHCWGNGGGGRLGAGDRASRVPSKVLDFPPAQATLASGPAGGDGGDPILWATVAAGVLLVGLGLALLGFRAAR